MSFMLVQTPDPNTLRDALPSFDKATHIFLPINDCTNPNLAEGGSHWTLLLVSLLDGLAFHYDSLHNANVREASIATQKLSILCRTRLQFINLQDTPEQTNGSDCGVHVCMTMKYLLTRRLLQRDATEKVTMSMANTRMDAKKGRQEMVELIEDYRKEGRRSQSRSRTPQGRKSSDNPPRIGD
ncbi:hypothetical protein FH972_020989 [Carpinus fangiana]|uniref:Ubiquitin-like protease family profile domain-containing protein n=1 Tax=Carpinus fangiana TaxID=176857 RepID=A0A5N6KN16_9ROSI|nr:hypothetical protein FH972_020989 [Carpinus fangiana]